MGAGAQKSGGAAALPAPPPPRSLFELARIKAAKRSTVTSIAKWSNTTSEENALRATGEEQPNRFSRRSLKFAS